MSFLNAPADPKNSTFMHIASYFNGAPEHGYSKKEGFAEQRNKVALLCGTVKRLIPNYLRTTKKAGVREVNFFRRVTNTQNPTLINDELIMTIDDTGYQLYGAFQNDRFLRNFLSVFKESGWEPKSVEAMLKSYGKVDPFSFDPTSQTLDDLEAYCGNMIGQNYHRGEVEKFYFACKRKFFTNPEPTPSQPTPASTTRSPERGPQALGSLMAHLMPVN